MGAGLYQGATDCRWICRAVLYSSWEHDISFQCQARPPTCFSVVVRPRRDPMDIFARCGHVRHCRHLWTQNDLVKRLRMLS